MCTYCTSSKPLLLGLAEKKDSLQYKYIKNNKINNKVCLCFLEMTWNGEDLKLGTWLFRFQLLEQCFSGCKCMCIQTLHYPLRLHNTVIVVVNLNVSTRLVDGVRSLMINHLQTTSTYGRVILNMLHSWHTCMKTLLSDSQTLFTLQHMSTAHAGRYLGLDELLNFFIILGEG